MELHRPWCRLVSMGKASRHRCRTYGRNRDLGSCRAYFYCPRREKLCRVDQNKPRYTSCLDKVLLWSLSSSASLEFF